MMSKIPLAPVFSKQKPTQGFTLMEIVIAIIVMALLASLAMPRMLGMRDRAYAGEAIRMMSAIRDSMMRCYTRNVELTGFEWIDGGGQQLCTINGAQTTLDIDNPNSNPNSQFNYYAVYATIPAPPFPNIEFVWIEAHYKPDLGATNSKLVWLGENSPILIGCEGAVGTYSCLTGRFKFIQQGLSN